MDNNYIHKSMTIPETTNTILKDSGILKAFGFSKILNWCIEGYLPTILKNFGVDTDTYKEYLIATEYEKRRDITTKIISQLTSKLYFHNNFEKKFKLFLSLAKNKKIVDDFLKASIEQSKYYFDNDEMTNKIKLYQKKLNTMTIQEFKILFEIEIRELKFKLKGDLKNGKQHN